MIKTYPEGVRLGGGLHKCRPPLGIPGGVPAKEGGTPNPPLCSFPTLYVYTPSLSQIYL